MDSGPQKRTGKCLEAEMEVAKLQIPEDFLVAAAPEIHLVRPYSEAQILGTGAVAMNLRFGDLLGAPGDACHQAAIAKIIAKHPWMTLK